MGNNTWNALTSASSPVVSTPPATNTNTNTNTGNTTTQTPQTSSPTTQYSEYKPSDAVAQAEALLNQHLAQKPGDYQSTWQDQLNEIIQQIQNRDKFSYDLNGDALYQQYKDQYVTQGKMAMMDAMGMAQAATGGYGNSYAQSVGQQAYQGYLQNLNDKVPELYKLAMDKYQMEGDEMYSQYALMAQQEEQDYGRYRDQVGDWEAYRDYLAGRYDSERDYDYGIYADDRNFNYQVDRDKVADSQWQAEFDEAKRQFDQQYALASSSKGGSGGSGGSGSGYNNMGYGSDIVAKAQAYVGASSDGLWGSNSEAAAKAMGFGSLTDVVAALYKEGILGGDPDPEPNLTVPKTYSELSRYLSSGNFDKGTISLLITDALADGIINQNQAQQLRNAYIPKATTTIN